MSKRARLHDFTARRRLRELAQRISDLVGRDVLPELIVAEATAWGCPEEALPCALALEKGLHEQDMLRELAHDVMTILAEPFDYDEDYDGGLSPEQRERNGLYAAAFLEQYRTPESPV